MTTIQPTRLPLDCEGQHAEFIRAGFRFQEYHQGDPLFRCAYLPAGWRAHGPRRTPVEIVDRMDRLRVTIRYGVRPVLQRRGTIGLEPAARMRMIPLREYLAWSVARDEQVIPDPKWATPKEIYALAVEEVARATERADYFDRIDQGRNAKRFEDLRAAYAAVALAYYPTNRLEKAA